MRIVPAHRMSRAHHASRKGGDVTSEQTFTVTLEQQKDFEFLVRFDKDAVADLATDEGAPLGRDAGPNPARLLAAAVANCLSASLLFALRKFRNQPEPITAAATTRIARNARNRLRIAGIAVQIRTGGKGAQMELLDRVLAQFEEFCIVTQSVRDGIAVEVSVVDAEGAVLK